MTTKPSWIPADFDPKPEDTALFPPFSMARDETAAAADKAHHSAEQKRSERGKFARPQRMTVIDAGEQVKES